MKKSLFFVFWMALLGGPLAAQNVIEVSGEYYGHVLWNADTVRVVGDVLITEGVDGLRSSARLQVNAGTSVVAQGHYKITVLNGTLVARGTEDAPIVFTAQNPSSGWQGLHVLTEGSEKDTLLMEYCTISHAKMTAQIPEDERNGAGLYLSNASHGFKYCRLSHCTIAHNKTLTSSGQNGNKGGGLFLHNPGTCLIEHCRFEDNQAYSGGALVLSGLRHLNVKNCEFVGNLADAGSALFMHMGEVSLGANGPEVCNNYIHGNHGNAVYLAWDVSTGKFHDNVIVNNEGRTPLIGATSPNASLYYNNTIVLNQSSGFMDDQVGGIWTIGQQKIFNNIVYGNGASFSFGERQIGFDHFYGDPTIFNNCFSYYHNYPCSVYGEPEFVSPSFGLGSTYDLPDADWSLQPTSPCINAGSTNMSGYPSTDFYGNPRIKDGVIDIGATEFQGFEAVNEMQSAPLFKVYPNPGTDRLNIMAVAEQPFSVSVYDLTGRLVFFSESASPLTEIDTEEWPSGMYFWKINVGPSTLQQTQGSEAIVETGKWIKQ